MGGPLSSPPRLLAVDLDGTLVAADGCIAPRDREAVVRARRDGIVVTIATGRLSPFALQTARSLELRAPLIVADGAALVDARNGAAIETAGMDRGALLQLLDIARTHDLSSFVCMPDRIVGSPGGRRWTRHLWSWGPDVTFRGGLEEVCSRVAVVMTLSVGDRSAIDHASTVGARVIGECVQLAAFPLGEEGGPWALRAQPPGVNKGAMLARLARRLGVPRERVAAVGDWLNDVSMFGWAGTSFAMAQAPPDVRRRATCVLASSTRTGGGVAEAIERWRRDAS